MRYLLALIFTIFAAAAGAEPFPALYDVTGVAANDVLNIRAAPDASGALIGTLAPDARDVEVIRLADGGGWGLVNTNERSGWVAMRYLARQPGQEEGDWPATLACSGVEPFWSLGLAANGEAIFSLAGYEPFTFAPVSRYGSIMRPDRLLFEAGNGAGEVIGFVSREACNDGMSERDYGFAIDLLARIPFAPGPYSGCCSIGQ